MTAQFFEKCSHSDRSLHRIVSCGRIDKNPHESPRIFTRGGSLVFIVGLLLITTIAGCSFFIPPASEEKLDLTQSHWFHYEATRRGGFLFKTDDNGTLNVKMCAEPAPDAALARTADIIAKGGYQGVTAEAQAKLSEQLAQLGGRTETVLILRESFFRLCELSINSKLGPNDLRELYKMVLDAAVALANADLMNAQATATKADSELENARNERMRIQKLR